VAAPGTPLWRNTTTNVTVVAEDAAGRQLECTWYVHVPPLVVVGTTVVDVPESSNGTAVAQSSRFYSVGAGIAGRVYKLSGRVSDRVGGAGSSIRARLRNGSNKYTGSLRLQENRTKGTVVVPPVPIRYRWEISDVELDLLSERLSKATTVAIKAYGQVLERF
jgi:hypothetical protein